MAVRRDESRCENLALRIENAVRAGRLRRLGGTQRGDLSVLADRDIAEEGLEARGSRDDQGISDEELECLLGGAHSGRAGWCLARGWRDAFVMQGMFGGREARRHDRTGPLGEPGARRVPAWACTGIPTRFGSFSNGSAG